MEYGLLKRVASIEWRQNNNMKSFLQYLREKALHKLTSTNLQSYLSRTIIPPERFAGHVSWKDEPTLKGGDLMFPNHTEKIDILKKFGKLPPNEKIFFLVTKEMSSVNSKRMVKIDTKKLVMYNISTDYSINPKGQDIVDLFLR